MSNIVAENETLHLCSSCIVFLCDTKKTKGFMKTQGLFSVIDVYGKIMHVENESSISGNETRDVKDLIVNFIV